MDITIPTIPIGVLTLLAFFGPYAVGLLNGVLPFVTKPWQKKAVALVVALLLAAAVLVLYLAITGDWPTSWPIWVLLSVLVLTASYALVTKPTAKRIQDEYTRS